MYYYVFLLQHSFWSSYVYFFHMACLIIFLDTNERHDDDADGEGKGRGPSLAG